MEKDLKKGKLLKACVLVIKKRFKFRHLLFLAILMTFNSYAWFIYMNKISSDIDVQVKAWNVSFEFDNETMTDYVSFAIDDIYPGMVDNVQSLVVSNDGDVDAELSYEIVSVMVLGVEYTTDDDSYTSLDLQQKLEEEYPFKIKLSTSNGILAGDGGTEEFMVTALWPYESYDEAGNINDEEDTYWGNQAYQFSQSNPDDPCLSLKVKLSATQINSN